jgi:hypothetical protein
MTTTLTVDAAGAWAGLVQGYTKLAVISGVGVRNYYRRLGYELRGEGEFLIKDLKPQQQQQQQQRGAAGDATPPPAVAGAQSTRSPERAAAAEEETEAEVSSGLAAAAACVGLTSLGLALCATLGMQSRTR